MFGNTVAAKKKNLIHAIPIIYGGFRQKNGAFLFLAGKRSLHEKTRLQASIPIGDERFRIKGSANLEKPPD